MDWGIFKRHPYLTALGAIAVFVVVYLLRGSGSSSSATGASSGTSAQDVQLAQLSAAQNVAQTQAQAQLQVAGLQAGVQQQAIAAQQETTDTQTNAQLQAILAQTQAQTAIATEQTQGQTAQAQIYGGIIKDQYDSQVAEHQATIDYLNNLTNQQAAVATTQINANYGIASQQLNLTYQNNQNVLKNINTFNGSQNKLSLLLAVAGDQQAANTAAAGSTISNSSDNSLWASLGNAGAGVLSTLLA